MPYIEDANSQGVAVTARRLCLAQASGLVPTDVVAFTMRPPNRKGPVDNPATKEAWPSAARCRGLPATFGSLGVPAPLVATFDVAGITVTLPDALAGRDILGQGRAELRARAEPAERMLDPVRAELAELGRA